MNELLDIISWLCILGGFLLSFIRMIESLYYTPIQAANDAMLKIQRNFDVIRPAIVCIIGIVMMMVRK